MMSKFITILLTVFLLTSCKKEYTCECLRETGAFVASYTLKEKREKAEERCESTVIAGSGQITTICKLK